MVMGAAVLCASRAAFAGDLARIEGAHKDKSSDSSSSSSSSGSSSGSSKKSDGEGIVGRVVGGVLSSMLQSRSGSGSGEEDSRVGSPVNALAMDSYREDRPTAYAHVTGPDPQMRRYGELSVAGFSTITPRIRALDTQLNVFLHAFTMHAAVTRYYETSAETVPTLDFFRLQLGLNVFHGWVDGAELHVTGGVIAMHGSEWTPGGGPRAELRLYPIRPLSLDAVVDASFFAHGPPLIEGQVLPGVTFARLDLRAGAGVLYQPGVAPILGPRVQVGIRF